MHVYVLFAQCVNSDILYLGAGDSACRGQPQGHVTFVTRLNAKENTSYHEESKTPALRGTQWSGGGY